MPTITQTISADEAGMAHTVHASSYQICEILVLKARVLRLRDMGVLRRGQTPQSDDWAHGMLEFERADAELPRRLVLRAYRSAPGHGVMFALVRPELVGIAGGCLKLRGIEAFRFANGTTAALMQEWLVEVLTSTRSAASDPE